ncbi:MAG: hypothetical protein ABWZ82_03995 [Candidatus Limnocylindrales bacterium]
MRLPGRKGDAAAPGRAQIPLFVVCPVCHLRNDVSARFCRDCGLPLGAPRDPVRGTTTRRADLPSDRGAGIAAVLSLAAIVVIAGMAGFLVLRSFESATTAGASASSSTGPIAAVPSDHPVPSTAPQASVDANPPAEPSSTGPGEPTPRPRPTIQPTEQPSDEPTARPLTTRTGWTCGSAAIQDPLLGRWRIAQPRFGRQAGFDRLTFDLTRLDGEARRGVIVRMRFLRPAQAASRYGVDTPSGDRAIVLTFDGPINLRGDVSERPGLEALESLEARTDDEGVVHAVVGIAGDGCVRLSANDWRTGSGDTTEAKLVVDIRR